MVSSLRPCTRLALLLACTAPLASAQFSFTDRTSLLSNDGLGNNRCNSGAAIGVIDMNGDGKDDILRLHNNRVIAIETQTTPNAAFGHNVIGNSPITPWALAVADVDDNGFNDFVLCPFGGGIRLYKANATGTGYDSPITVPSSNSVACQGTLFADLDNDGTIDLFSCHDTGDNGMWPNDGAGNFVRDDSLIAADNVSGGNYAALWTDYDKDGKLDLYLSKCQQGNSNPSSPGRINRLFKSSGGSFSDVAPGLGLADGSQTWCSDFADIDNDGDMDLFILNHAESGNNNPNLLYRNNGDGTFTNVTATSGLGTELAGDDGIQTLFRDFDNDTFVDLLCSTTGSDYVLYHNDGDGTFTPTRPFRAGGTTGGGAGSNISHVHSFACGDLNSDGFVDVYVGRGSGFISTSNNPDLLFMNNLPNAGNTNHWITIQLTGVATNKGAIGARVDLIGLWGTQTREVRSGEGYGIQNSHNLYFGLADKLTDGKIPQVVVTWPSGTTQTLTDVDPDQVLSITEEFVYSPPSITSSSSVGGAVSASFTYRITADNIPTDFSIANEPAGMTVSDNGVVSWAPPAVGTYTFDATASNPAGSDTKTVTITVIANPLPASFEAENFIVGTGGTADWVPQTSVTHDGVDAAASPDLGDGQSSFLEVTVNGPGEASFWWRVSSEDNYDFLTFFVDGSQVAAESGNSGWLQRSYSVPAGPHTLRWEYSKDGSVSEGQDMGWVDEFAFEGQDTDADGLDDQWEIANFGDLSQTAEDDFDGDGRSNGSEQLAMTDPTDSSSRLEIKDAQRVNESTIDLTWDTATGLTYRIEGSTDLITWDLVASGIPGTGGEVTRAAETGIGKGVTLVADDAVAYAFVPSDDSYGTTWRGGDETAFDAAGGLAGWLTGPQAVGYESSAFGIDYGDYVGIDTLSIQDNINPTVYVRIPFEVDDPASVTALTLGMRADDGYVAFLNGTEVASDNAPATLTWNSAATATTSDGDAVVFSDQNLSASIGALIPGQNILAIHGLNRSAGSSDMLIGTRLTADLAAVAPERYYWRVVVEE